MPRTSIDFSKHELIRTESEFHKTFYIKIPDTYNRCIRFTIIDNVTLVTGDYGNWVFCRSFIPSISDEKISDGYWVEKLEIGSTQSGQEWDSEATKNEIEYMLNGGAYEYGYRDEDLKSVIEYFESCHESCDDLEHEYLSVAGSLPKCMDYDNIIFHNRVKPWLKSVFDGFEYICTLLKSEHDRI